MNVFAGKCAIVTGAAYGIGFAAARRFAEAGADIVIADIKGQDEAAQRLRAAGANVLPVFTDVTDDGSVDDLVKAVIDRFGRVDILVNNAAISAELRPAPFEQGASADWLRIYDVNVVGVFRMCRAVSPHMRAARSGRIINVASGAAFKGSAGMLHYVASKGAIISMTRSLASEFGGDGVVVNAVSPGFTLTESVLAAPEVLKAYSAAAIPARALKREAVADDVASVIFFLAGADSGFVTGQVIAADGGSVFH